MKYIKRALLVVQLCFLFVLSAEASPEIGISENAKFSILTCSPGPDLYSLFGHSAIRFQDNINGQIIDWVYNYGTFEFDDDFYWKFAMGKLDYMLSKEDFGYFQQGYILEGRGIFEQELLLNQDEKKKLFDLLEENFLPENRTYRYDFFYDNCSTRIRDVIAKAVKSNIDFTYSYPREFTFRQAIQTYLNYQPWSDLGIDIALGMPCDAKAQKGQMMFLPDSLMHEFDNAQLQSQPLVLPNQEIMPVDYELSETTKFTPLVVFFIFLVLHIAMGLIFIKRKQFFQLSDRILLFVSGMTGVVVIFLWFFTDHSATAWNLNILWANPINILLAFTAKNKLLGWKKTYLTCYFFILMVTLAAWFALPQRLHLSIIALVVGLIFTCLKMVRPQLFSKPISTRTF